MFSKCSLAVLTCGESPYPCPHTADALGQHHSLAEACAALQSDFMETLSAMLDAGFDVHLPRSLVDSRLFGCEPDAVGEIAGNLYEDVLANSRSGARRRVGPSLTVAGMSKEEALEVAYKTRVVNRFARLLENLSAFAYHAFVDRMEYAPVFVQLHTSVSHFRCSILKDCDPNHFLSERRNRSSDARVDRVARGVEHLYSSQGWRVCQQNPLMPSSRFLRRADLPVASTMGSILDVDIELFVRLADTLPVRRAFILGNAFGFSTLVLYKLFRAEIDVLDAQVDEDGEVQENLVAGFNLTRSLVQQTGWPVRLVSGMFS